jgi:glycogen(starch) synthase
MRVLHLTRDFPPRNAGGISTAVGGMVRALDTRGVRSSIVSFDAWRPLRNGGVTEPASIEGNVMRVTSPAHHDHIIAFGREAKPDVVHVHDGLLWEYASAFGANKSVFTMHVAHAVLRRLRGSSQATMSEDTQVRAMAEADVVTVPCAALALDGAVRIPFGIDPPEQHSSSPRSGVLFAARLTDIKGVAEMFEAMEAVCAAHTDVTLRIAGGLIENRKAERRRKRRFDDTASPRLATATTWLGWLGRDALESEYRRAAILIAPSWHETYGLTVLEAMAHGVAVVASDVHGHAELVDHGRTGLLFPPRDAASLANAIGELVSQPARARRLGEAAAIEVRRQRSWSRLIGDWVEIYR